MGKKACQPYLTKLAKKMCITPKPFMLICPSCHWQQPYEFKSDALIFDIPTDCPVCGHTPLDTKPLDSLSIASKLKTFLFD
ncbi:MAG: hypothetical protein ACNA7G_10620 [Methylobacter sp.]